ALAPVLMAARVITDSLANTIGRQTGTDLVFYAVNRKGSRELTVSPAKFGSRASVRSAVEGSLMSDTTGGQMDSHNMMMTSSARRDVVLGGRNYVGQHVELLSAGGREVGGFIALRDKDKELAAFYKLRNTLLLTGLGGILIAF